jgi:hypothetical protein
LEKIRFHFDEQVERAIAEALRRRGIEEQLAFAISQERAIFTQDDDFLAIHQRGLEHCGIVYSHQNSRSLGEIVRGLILIWEVLEPSDMQNHVEFI